MPKLASARWENSNILTRGLRLFAFLLNSQSGGGYLLMLFSVASETLFKRMKNSHKFYQGLVSYTSQTPMHFI